MADDRDRPRRPITLDALRAAGESVARVRRVEYRRVYRGVWVHRDDVDADTPARAALALHGDAAWLSRTSAAIAQGFPVPEQSFVHVTVAEPHERRFRPGIKSHVTQRERRLLDVRGMPVTDPATTFVECAGMLSLVDLVVLGDAMVKRTSLTASALRRHCNASTDYYVGAARAAAGLVRDGVDSPPESRTRLLLVLGGLPEPQVDFKVRDDDGEVLRRYDLYYREARVVVEYDGRQHAESRKQWRTDLQRREELDDLDRRIIVVTHDDLRTPERTLRRVRRVLISRGMDLPPASDRWRDHFAA